MLINILIEQWVLILFVVGSILALRKDAVIRKNNKYNKQSESNTGPHRTAHKLRRLRGFATITAVEASHYCACAPPGEPRRSAKNKMSLDTKTDAIFRELVGPLADRLSGSHFLADVSARIAVVLAKDKTLTEEIKKAKEIGFHLVDWQTNAAFIVALALFPERFTDDEIDEGVTDFLIHAPSHVTRAAKLFGVDCDTFEDENK